MKFTDKVARHHELLAQSRKYKAIGCLDIASAFFNAARYVLE